MRAPLAQAADQGLLNARILVEPEKAVRAEIDHAPSEHRHLPIRPELICDQALEMGVGELLRIVLEEAHQVQLAG